MTVMAVLAAFTLAMAMPAFAGAPDKGKSAEAPGQAADKGKTAGDKDGDADSDPSTSYTEDNDTNDGDTPNNVADEGDNRHPSGKDRSVENGNSGNQGNSESAPDEDGHGPERDYNGTDKPNGPGGMDLADQDGNNGCGNDDDFEDDNEGWCGQKPKKVKTEPEVIVPEEETPEEETPEVPEEETPEVPEVDDEVIVETPEEEEIPDEVLNETIEAPQSEVLGILLHQDATPEAEAELVEAAGEATGEAGALPFTGGEVLPLLAVAFGLLLMGLGTRKLAKDHS